MAETRMATRVGKHHAMKQPPPRNTKVSKAALAASAEKENFVPQKSSKTKSINGIFDHAKIIKQKRERERERQHDASHVLQPNATGVADQNAQADFFGDSIRKSIPDPNFLKNIQHPNCDPPGSFGFFDALHAYSKGVTTAQQDEQKHRKQALENRRMGLDDDGEPLDRPNLPTWEDIEKLKAQTEALSKPTHEDIANEEMTVVVDQKNGTQLTRTVRFGDTLQEFTERYERKLARLHALETEQKQVEGEVDALAKELTDGDEEEKKAKHEHEGELAGLQAELEDIEEQAKVEASQAKKEEQAKIRETNRKIQRLWDEIA